MEDGGRADAELVSAVRLLRLLLVNVGMLDAVRLAPEGRWREALQRVYNA